MNPVRASFETTDQAFPQGTNAAGFLLTLTHVLIDGAADAQAPAVTGRAALDSREIVIADVPVGTYKGKIALIGSDSDELAPAVEDPAPLIIAQAQPLSLPVPVSLTLTRP